jgi:hypothetical protein
MAAVAAIALTGATAAAACGDDDDEGNEAAADLAGTYDNFKRDLQATANIEEAPDDIKDGLKDDCDTLKNEIDADDVDEFCDDLSAAIDDENQTDYEAVRARVGDIEDDFTQAVGDRADDDTDEDGPDNPLQGGDEGDSSDD